MFPFQLVVIGKDLYRLNTQTGSAFVHKDGKWVRIKEDSEA